MKANELRIGNFITGTYTDYDSHAEKYDICKVVTLDSVGTTEYAIWVEGNANLERYDSFDPIPLTEEWLLKFGFKKDKYMKAWHISGIKGLDGFELVPIDVLSTDQKGYGFATEEPPFSEVFIQYVHQLQNLYFALIGEELEIN